MLNLKSIFTLFRNKTCKHLFTKKLVYTLWWCNSWFRMYWCFLVKVTTLKSSWISQLCFPPKGLSSDFNKQWLYISRLKGGKLNILHKLFGHLVFLNWEFKSDAECVTCSPNSNIFNIGCNCLPYFQCGDISVCCVALIKRFADLNYLLLIGLHISSCSFLPHNPTPSSPPPYLSSEGKGQVTCSGHMTRTSTSPLIYHVIIKTTPN